jgi:PAS domain S-box-containing protein
MSSSGEQLPAVTDDELSAAPPSVRARMQALERALQARAEGAARPMEVRATDPTDARDVFFEVSLDHLCVATFDGYLAQLNPSWTRTLGWTLEELMARPSIEFVHPDDREATIAARSRVMAGEPLRGLCNRYLCRDGSYRWFEWRSVGHVDRGLVYAVARDVTVERSAQRELAELSERLSATLASIADGVIATAADATVLRMNPVAERLTGWPLAEARGRALAEVLRVVDPETREPVSPAVERTAEEGRPSDPVGYTLLIARDGVERPVASSFAPVRNAAGDASGAVIVFRDMSAEREARKSQAQLQRQLIFADRMVSVGTLAAGVAHEINNPLAYVMANLEMLAAELERPGLSPTSSLRMEWVGMARDAWDGAERIKKIVRGLKTFSRAEEERRAVIEVRPVIELSIDMAYNEIRHRARLVKDYGDTPRVEADDAHLGQVLINLLVNAAQALPEGAAESNEIRVVTSTDPRGWAVIEVRDTGSGIPTEVLGRIFDPFFTTKPVGVGTGLGLSICHSIVTRMGGEITARNLDGRGAALRVSLPPARALDPAEAPLPATGQAPARRASVLVVDDERAIGVILGRVLREHAVTVVTSAREAFDLIMGGANFDVVLSDVMMPEMSGMDLYATLTRLRPEAAERMVFLTGGAFTEAAKEFLDAVPNERIEKPFDAAAVRALVGRFVP